MFRPARRRFLARLLGGALTIGAGFSLAPIDARQAPLATRVLFIGNSYTYYSNLPEILTKLAAARRQKVEALMVAPGGLRLKDHWDRGSSLAALHGRQWDYVVLQEQSMLGVSYYLDGKARVSSDEVFRPYAEKWAAEVHAVGAVPIFYLTWARKASPEDQPRLNSAYIRAAKAGDARVAPVGMAWAEVRREAPSIDLFLQDGSHPSAAGSYLAACTLYAALFNQSPVGLPATISGVPTNVDTGALEPSKTVVLVGIDPDTARVLQDAAWDAWKATAKPGFFDVAPVAPPTIAPLPTGMPLSPALIAGTWKGSFALYPSSRTDMVLRLDHGAAGWKGRLELRYHVKEARDQAFDLADLEVAGREMSFTNPSARQSVVMRFRGVAPRAGVLRGTVDASGASADSPLHLQGTWELRKQ
jgi:hypothetical protein